ncbi:unnamed protein product, partial [Rotaria magnacalcarata]
GLSEPIRIIGIYWPTSQQRDLDEILPYVVDGTILSGDFNATVKEWNSPITDRRGAHVKEWINESNLDYIPLTSNSSKRSLRNIDLSFSNMSTISSEALFLALVIIGRLCYRVRTFFSILTVFVLIQIGRHLKQ